MTKVVIKDESAPGAAATPADTGPVLKSDEARDAQGRVLKVRRLGALGKVDLADLVGAVRSQNETVMQHCVVAFSVTAIDGQPVFPPKNWMELRALIGRLDDEGISAAATKLIENGWIEVQAQGGQDLAQEAADLKNS